jgi:preprotein translocase subunit SecD
LVQVLGADNIQKGLISVLVGFGLVLIFMAWRYRVFGLVANLALTLNLVTIISILSLIQGDTHTPWNSRNCSDCGYGS